MRNYSSDEADDLPRRRENSAKIYLLDRMIEQDFKYVNNHDMSIIYHAFINNRKDCLGPQLHHAFMAYFNTDLAMKLDHLSMTMIQVAIFDQRTYAALDEFYQLFTPLK